MIKLILFRYRIPVIMLFIFGGIAITDRQGLQAQNRPLKLTGGFSLSGRMYYADGIENRRDPFTGLATANLQFNLFGFQSGLNLTYTTEESRYQQSFNRLAFQTGWGWGRLSAGDVSPNMGRYAMQGSTVRGGHLEINTPKFFGGFSGGQNRKAVNFDPNTPFVPASFQRLLYSGNVGYGNRRKSFVSLGAMYANDVLGSINEFGDIRPAENLVITAEGGVQLLDDRMRVAGQLSSSALTRDVRNPLQTKDSPIPGFIDPIFDSREGSSFNLAGDIEMSFRSPVFGLNSRFSRINPGYESLGMQYLVNDQQVIMLAPTVALLDQRLNITVNYTTARNNLNNQMLSTTERQQTGLNFTGKVSEMLMITGGYMRMGVHNNPSPEVEDPVEIQMSFVAQTFMFSPVLMLKRADITHSVTLSGALQFSDDRSLAVQQGLRDAKAQDMYMGMLNYTIQFPSGFSLNNSASYVTSKAPNLDISSYGLTTGTGFTMLENKLNLNVNAGWSANYTSFFVQGHSITRGTNQITGQIGANYRVARKTSLRFQSRLMQNLQTQGAAPNFLENISEISLIQRL